MSPGCASRAFQARRKIGSELFDNSWPAPSAAVNRSGQSFALQLENAANLQKITVILDAWFHNTWVPLFMMLSPVPGFTSNLHCWECLSRSNISPDMFHDSGTDVSPIMRRRPNEIAKAVHAIFHTLKPWKAST